MVNDNFFAFDVMKYEEIFACYSIFRSIEGMSSDYFVEGYYSK